MLDIRLIRENPEKLKEACKKKNATCDVDGFLNLDKRKRELMVKTEGLKANQNKLGKDQIEEARKIKEEIKQLDPEILEIEKKLNSLLMQFPNIPFDDVPVGKDDSENVVLRKEGKIQKFTFQPKDYMQIGESLGLIDIERAGKVAGSRFGYIKNELAIIEFGLVNLAMDIGRKKGFIPLIPPVMLKEEMARGTGYFEAGDEKEAYFLPEDKMYLAGTSEQSVVAMHAGEVLQEKDLPLRYISFSTCFSSSI